MTYKRAHVAVVILTMNQRDDTLRCLSSLAAIKQPSFNVLLWDNHSEDNTVEAVRNAFPEVLVHSHSSNLGVASGRNEAARLAIATWAPTHLLFLDNDMVVDPEFVSALLDEFVQDERVGQAQAKLRLADDRERLNDGGGIKVNFLLGSTGHVGFGEIDRGQYDQVKQCISCGGAMMVRTDVFEELNGFDPIFDPYGPEDIDFSLRLSEAGYLALYVPQAVAYHALNHTFGRGYTAAYARHKTFKWLLLLQRHAPRWQRIFFLGITAPLLFTKVVIREAARGNFTVFKALAKGVLDIGKTKRRQVHYRQASAARRPGDSW